jgi:predicted Na+-dependent transporter
MAQVHWIRSNGFILALTVAVVVAFLWPEPGARGGFLHADFVNNFGIALILFLQGLSLAFEKIKSGAGNWRLHAIIQTFTFVVFPLVGFYFTSSCRCVGRVSRKQSATDFYISACCRPRFQPRWC